MEWGCWMVFLRLALTVIDRTLIEVRRRDGWGVVQIVAALGRSPSVISGELAAAQCHSKHRRWLEIHIYHRLDPNVRPRAVSIAMMARCSFNVIGARDELCSSSRKAANSEPRREGGLADGGCTTCTRHGSGQGRAGQGAYIFGDFDLG
jgi:hypothetical protein